MSAATPRSRWFKLVWIIPSIIVVAALAVLAARGLRALPAVQDFIRAYPGHSELPSWVPVGLPAWLQWQHFLSAFFTLLIVRTGWQVHSGKRPEAYWTRIQGRPIRTRGQPVRIALHLWLHLGVGALWVLNGVAFYVLLFSTGQWARIIPTRWDVFPNAISAGVQYVSLDWPTENGWINYNGLQLLTYFVTVFIAAPLAIATGLRMAPGLANWWRRYEKTYPVQVARAIHYPVFIYFIAFVIVHVFLVLATGALRNLNHMYGNSDTVSWVGFGFFVGSLVLMALAWFAIRPTLLSPVASLTGRVGR